MILSCYVRHCSSCVVSAGILRVLGSDIAELPLVATSREHQGQVCVLISTYISDASCL